MRSFTASARLSVPQDAELVTGASLFNGNYRHSHPPSFVRVVAMLRDAGSEALRRTQFTGRLRSNC